MLEPFISENSAPVAIASSTGTLLLRIFAATMMWPFSRVNGTSASTFAAAGLAKRGALHTNSSNGRSNVFVIVFMGSGQPVTKLSQLTRSGNHCNRIIVPLLGVRRLVGAFAAPEESADSRRTPKRLIAKFAG